ncbi:MAG: polyhydroxybutyrate depolymerase [Betaproteobacteria bacterium]|nr:polyhydroxybutyrate depolymerase [Betaproteobacteria bacterium]
MTPHSLLHQLFPAVLLALPLAAAAALAPGDHEFALTHKALRRSYLVHVPPQAQAGRPLPVVINFHGGGGHAKAHQAYVRMDGTADREGFIAVYPNGTGGIAGRFLTWNAGTCCGSAAAARMDDVGYALAVLDDLAKRIPINRARVYATGLSNGSMMAYRLAAEAPERIAAVAGVAGAMTLPRFAPRLPVPVMHIHSVDDARALYGGGLGPAFPLTDTRVFHQPVGAMLKKWLDRNQCPVQPAAVAYATGRPGAPDAGHTATRLTYKPCIAGTEVVLWKLTGAGHVWPGGVQDYLPLLLGPGTAVIDANAEMWRFFSRFRREAK